MADEQTQHDSADTITVVTPAQGAPDVASGSKEAASPAPAATDIATGKRKELASGATGAKSIPKRIRLTNGKKTTKSAESAERTTVRSASSANGPTAQAQQSLVASNTDQPEPCKPTISETVNKSTPTTTAKEPIATALQVTNQAGSLLLSSQPRTSSVTNFDGAAAGPATARSATNTALLSAQTSMSTTMVPPKAPSTSSAAVLNGDLEGAKMAYAHGSCLQAAQLRRPSRRPPRLQVTAAWQQYCEQEFGTFAILESEKERHLQDGAPTPKARPAALPAPEPSLFGKQTILAGVQQFRQAASAISAENRNLRSEVERLGSEVRNVEALRASNNRMSTQITATIPDLKNRNKELNEEIDRLEAQAVRREKTNEAGHKEKLSLKAKIATLEKSCKELQDKEEQLKLRATALEQEKQEMRGEKEALSLEVDDLRQTLGYRRLKSGTSGDGKGD